MSLLPVEAMAQTTLWGRSWPASYASAGEETARLQRGTALVPLQHFEWLHLKGPDAADYRWSQALPDICRYCSQENILYLFPKRE